MHVDLSRSQVLQFWLLQATQVFVVLRVNPDGQILHPPLQFVWGSHDPPIKL